MPETGSSRPPSPGRRLMSYKSRTANRSRQSSKQPKSSYRRQRNIGLDGRVTYIQRMRRDYASARLGAEACIKSFLAPDTPPRIPPEPAHDVVPPGLSHRTSTRALTSTTEHIRCLRLHSIIIVGP